MRVLKISLVLLLLITAASADASAWPRLRRHHHSNYTHPRPAAVGAPLDGGLLAILGMAGAGYFLVRKRKKNE